MRAYFHQGLDFVLVDLWSQREATQNFVKGWHVDAVINWMRLFGTVSEIKLNRDSKGYLFRSAVGITDGFWFSDDDQLFVVNPGWH